MLRSVRLPGQHLCIRQRTHRENQSRTGARRRARARGAGRRAGVHSVRRRVAERGPAADRLLAPLQLRRLEPAPAPDRARRARRPVRVRGPGRGAGAVPRGQVLAARHVRDERARAHHAAQQPRPPALGVRAAHRSPPARRRLGRRTDRRLHAPAPAAPAAQLDPQNEHRQPRAERQQHRGEGRPRVGRRRLRVLQRLEGGSRADGAHRPAEAGAAAGAIPDVRRAPAGRRHRRRQPLHAARAGLARARRPPALRGRRPAAGLRWRTRRPAGGGARWAPRPPGGRGFTVLLALAAGVALTFLALPLVALFTEVPLRQVPELLRDPAVRDAIGVTVRTNAIANVLIVAVGTPVAYLLATRAFRGRTLAVTLVELPLVLPPAVAGIGLLAAFGAGGLVGKQLNEAGIVIPFSEWAVVLAVTFVASPFYVRQAITAFEAVDPTLVDAARTLGASPARTFARISLPLATAGLLAGWVLAFARGVGEFGATIVFAGNVRGETQTLTLAIYEQLDANFDLALAIGILLVVLSGSVLLSYKMLSTWRRSSSTSPAPFARTSSTSA